MPQLKVFNDNNRTYSIANQGNIIGMLQYRYWYSYKAHITIGKEDEYVIERKGFWGTQHEVKQHGSILFILKNQWDGGIALIKPGDKEHFYEFKPKGFFANGYVLTNYKSEELLLVTANFSWKKFTAGYNLDCKGNFGTTHLEQLLLLLCVYHYKTAQAMAMAGCN